MVGSFHKRGDFAWVQDVRANYVCIYRGIAATVFATAWLPWQIIRHHSKDAGLLQNERFADLSDVMSRAEAIVSGAAEQAYFVCLPPFWEPAL
jgi:hypothetical protein